MRYSNIANNSENKNKTKAQLQEDLGESQDVNQKIKIELSASQKELEKLQIKLNAVEKEKKNNHSEAQQRMTLSNRNLKLQKINQQCEAEKKKLHEDLETAEQMLVKQCEDHEKELKETRQKQAELEEKIEVLKKQLNAKGAQEIISSDISAPKSTFRVDLYPQEGKIQGRIEHLLSKEKKIFSGLDSTAILDFLNSHRPYIKEPLKTQPAKPVAADTASAFTPAKSVGAVPTPASAAVEKVPAPVTAAVDTVSAPATEVIPELETLNLTSVDVFLPDGSKPTGAIQHDQPFEVRIAFAIPDQVKTTRTQIHYTASIFAKSLLGGSHKLVGEISDILEVTEALTVNILPNTLASGVYKLETAMSFHLTGKEKQPRFISHESNPVNVY